ncbi:MULTISPECIES: hypothetical protein [unclassified Knoellia]|uniref:hypothetical protein n=1 Tax=Knoellia altitudinis TaxID=3404795 RepID=UPI003621D1B5
MLDDEPTRIRLSPREQLRRIQVLDPLSDLLDVPLEHGDRNCIYVPDVFQMLSTGHA